MQSRKKVKTECELAEIQVSYQSPASTLKFDNSFFVEYYVRSVWDKELIALQEQIYVFFLKNDLSLIGWRMVSMGTYNTAVLDIKLIITMALKCNASGLLIAHNHPSGSIRPSEADINLTRELLRACELMDLRFLDHLILSPADFVYYSFLDNGLVIPEQKQRKARALTGPLPKTKKEKAFTFVEKS